MRSISLNQTTPSNLADALITSIKIIAPLLFLLYAVFYFHTSHWIFLGLFVFGVLAIMNRIARITSATPVSKVTRLDIVTTDGGAFRQIQQKRQMRNSRAIVYDGGIVKNRAAK